MSYAICHTDGCENSGVPIDVGDLTYTDGDQTYTMGVNCGPCGQPITDVVDKAPK
jgi:hypothetical protein